MTCLSIKSDILPIAPLILQEFKKYEIQRQFSTQIFLVSKGNNISEI